MPTSGSDCPTSNIGSEIGVLRHPIWASWPDSLPERPLCADDFRQGSYRRQRQDALLHEHVEFNSPGRLGWLLFDVDTPDAYESWELARLPAPNVFVQNPSNGHGHLGYVLSEPVGLLGVSRVKPIALAADVQLGMTRRLGADLAYAGRMAKNPGHPRWRTSWIAARPYSLTELLEPLERRDVVRPEARCEHRGVSRNRDLFDDLRRFAYQNVLDWKRSGANRDQWLGRLTDVARGLNLGFADPLLLSEVRSIARSVARWTWRRFNSETFSAIQRRRGERGGAASGQTRSRNADAGVEVILSLIEPPSFRVREASAEPPIS